MKKQIKSCIAVFLAALIMFSCLSVGASALAEGDTVRVTGTNDWVQGFYYDFNGNFGTGHYGQHQWLKADGKIAYCVEPLKSLTAGSKTIKETWASFSANQQRMVTAAYIYGYNGSSRYGYSAATEYVATQAIIWAISFNVFNTSKEETLLNCAFSSKTSSSNRANGKAVYSKIKQQIISHYTVPSFNNTKLTLKYNPSTKKYEGSLSDNNGVLSGYAFSYNGVNFTKSGNKLNISTDKILNNAIVTGERTSNTYCNSLPALVAVYCVGSDQTTAMAINRKDPVHTYLSLTTESIGKIKIVKTSEDGIISNVPFHISGNGIEKDVVTGSDGTVIVGNLPIGDYTITEKTSEIYSSQYTHIITVTPGATSTVTVNNTLKRASLLVTKTAEDGFTEGIKFHLYGTSLSGAKVDEYEITNSNGVAKFLNVLIGTYTLEEVDTAEKYVVPVNQTIELEWTVINRAQVENKLKRTSLIVSKTSEDGLIEGVKFHLYGTSLSGAKVDEYAITNSDGTATFSNILIGTYTLEEVDSAERYIVPAKQTVELKYGVISKAQFDNKLKKYDVKLVKSDKDTGKAIAYAGACFNLYNSNGSLVDTYYTDSEGSISISDLTYGNYTFVEVKAPYGYVLDSTPIPFEVSQENLTDGVIKVTANDIAQKGNITINKSGEIFSSVSQSDDIFTPIYETKHLANAVFQIYAAEDIVTPDGTIRAKKGELVDEVTTSSNGIAKSKALYLGKYNIIEKSAPKTFYSDKKPYTAELTYAGQESKVTATTLSLVNERQRVSISLDKLLEKDNTFGLGFNNEITSVQFGIYAAEEIKAFDGSVIPKNGLVASDNCDENGKLAFTCDLPIGYKFYAQEITTDEHYIISDAKYEFTTEYKGQDVKSYNIVLNDGQSIGNDIKRGNINGIKVDDSNDGVPNAVIGLFSLDTKEFTKDTAIKWVLSSEDGSFSFANIPYGEYIIKEIVAPIGYLLNNTEYRVCIGVNGETVNLSIINEKIRGTLEIIKTDVSTGEALPDVGFRIYDKDKNVISEGVTDANGICTFSELEYGDYFYQEYSCSDAYVLDDSLYPFSIVDDGAVIKAEMTNKQKVGCLVIHKTDVSTGEALPDVGFRIYDKDKNVISEGITDANGICTFSDLEYGDYFYQEYSCSDAYVLDDSLYPFSIVDDGAVIKAEMTNKQKFGCFVIHKADNNGNALEGVEFTVMDKNGNVIACKTTDGSGTVSFELPYGEYIWYESKALKGYIVDSSQHSIKIEENGQLIEVNVVNNPIPVIITENPKTGSINYYKYLVPIAAISVITLIVTKRKKHSNEE